LIAKVVVMPKAVVNDPQGLTVKQGLRSLGFDEVDDVRIGKHIELRLDVDSEEAAVDRVEQMCRRLLANQVIEDFRYTLSRDPQGSAAPDLEGASGERPGAPTSE
jgi:phosphoribosylformylglycinamidine synthase